MTHLTIRRLVYAVAVIGTALETWRILVERSRAIVPGGPLLTTFRILCGLGIVAAAWEAWTIVNDRPGDTISATVRQLAHDQPFIVLAYGLLGGHLFWPLVDGEPAPVS
jgi:hypothetical protein